MGSYMSTRDVFSMRMSHTQRPWGSETSCREPLIKMQLWGMTQRRYVHQKRKKKSRGEKKGLYVFAVNCVSSTMSFGTRRHDRFRDIHYSYNTDMIKGAVVKIRSLVVKKVKYNNTETLFIHSLHEPASYSRPYPRNTSQNLQRRSEFN